LPAIVSSAHQYRISFHARQTTIRTSFRTWLEVAIHTRAEWGTHACFDRACGVGWLRFPKPHAPRRQIRGALLVAGHLYESNTLQAFTHALAQVPSLSVGLSIPIAPPGTRTPMGQHHWTPHLSMRGMRLARLGAVPRSVTSSAAVGPSCDVWRVAEIVHCRTPACRNGEARSLATARLRIHRIRYARFWTVRRRPYRDRVKRRHSDRTENSQRLAAACRRQRCFPSLRVLLDPWPIALLPTRTVI
jgi:hypothetical protein